MTSPGRDASPPGRVLKWLLRRRLDTEQSERVLDELAELYEHRTATLGPAEADRWLRREHRRLALRLATGPTLQGWRITSRSRGTGWRDSLRDVRQSVRSLARAPVFSIAIVATVGLGIGGTTLVFAVVDSVLVAPLPYSGADRMVLLRTVEGENMWGTSMADVHALEETPPEAFEEIAAYTYRTSRVARGAEVELRRTKWVTPGYFPLLGYDPVVGRHLDPAEGRPGGGPAVLVTERFRDRSFAADDLVLGQTVVVDGEPMPIVGVMPDRLGPIDRGIDVFPVLTVDVPPRKGPFFFPTIGRIRDGVAPEVARNQLAAVSRRIFPIWQSSFTQPDAVLGFVDLKQMVVGSAETTLLMVLTAVGFLLLIATANAASLLVARGVARAREIAVRTALGASSARVVRLLLAEALVIAVAAAALGFAMAVAGLAAVRRIGVGYLPRVDEIGLGPSSLLFFGGVTLGSWALFGLVAAIATVRGRGEGVATTTERSTATRGVTVLRRALAGAQFAVTIPMLVAAGLLLVSLERVRSEGYGFDPEGLVSMLVTLPGESYPAGSDVIDFWRATMPQIEALPGVLAAGLADARPPMPVGPNNFVLEDRPTRDGEPQHTAPWITADASFFPTLGLRVVDGRLYDDLPADTMRHAVVDERWAARYYPGESAVGRRFRSGGCTVEGCPWVEVVGVVEDVKTSGLADTRGMGTIYFDFSRDTYAAMRLHVRAEGDPLALVPAIRRVIRSRDGGVPIAEVLTTEDLATQSVAGRRYTSTLVTLIASVALFLSVIGVYGVMAYYVHQHMRELGIRIALGGGPRMALRMVVMRGMTVASVGTLVGILATPALTRPLSSILYGVTPNDPILIAAVATGTLFVALFATWVPGRAAARTDPASTLREE